MGLRDEIFEQPAVFERLLNSQLDPIREVAAAIRRADVDYVLMAARGTSDHAAIYAQYAWGVQNHLPVALAAPSQFSLYQARPRLRHALAAAVSQSGQSPDVIAVIEEGRRQGALTLALTNDPASPLAAAAAFTIPLQAGVERATAATKTYTAALLAIAILSAALNDDPAAFEELHRLPELAQRALEGEPQARQAAQTWAQVERCIVLGRGFNYATSKEWGLKMKEMAYVMAEAYSTADFMHGPLALLEPGFPLLAVLSPGAVYASLMGLLRSLRDEHKARLLVLSDSAEARALGDSALPVPPGAPEWLSPLVNIIPAQLFSYHLTLARGINPEQPRSIHKVTRTE